MNVTSYLISKKSDTYFDLPKGSILYTHVSKQVEYNCADTDYQFFINDTGGGTLHDYKEWFSAYRANKTYVDPEIEEKTQYTINVVLTNGLNLLFVTGDFELISGISAKEDVIIYYGV